MSCSLIHKIELNKNFGESFRQSLFQLVGSIRNPCTCQFVEIRTLNDGSCANVQVFNKNFKHLLRLFENVEIIIELSYCNIRITHRLEHKPLENTIFDVQPLYIINRGHDGHFQSSTEDPSNGPGEALLKIDIAMQLAQSVFSSKLSESNYGEKCFALKACKVFQSDLDVDKARSMNQWDLYDSISAELYEKERQVIDRRKFVGFLSCTRFDGLSVNEEYSYTNIKAKTFANPALGGSFLCLMGSGCFYSWPDKIDDVTSAFMNKTKVDLSRLLDDSNYRCTHGGTFSTTLGALIHEMGHIFDLAHTETGLMGNDIDFIHRFFLCENFTEVLPKRIVKSCQLTNQDVNESAKHKRLTKIRKPGGVFLEKYYEQKDNDMTFFEPNCLIALSCHRWFTQCHSHNNLSYCETTRTVNSEAFPIRIIEIRELDKNNSLLIKFWSHDSLKFEIPQNVKMKNVSLFAITCNGDVLKRDMM